MIRTWGPQNLYIIISTPSTRLGRLIDLQVAIFRLASLLNSNDRGRTRNFFSSKKVRLVNKNLAGERSL